MTRKQLLAFLLDQAGDRGLTTSEILRAGVGSRYGARLLELREDGWVVESTRIADGAWRYVLISKPAPPGQLPAPQSGQAPATHDSLGGVVAVVGEPVPLFKPEPTPHWDTAA